MRLSEDGLPPGQGHGATAQWTRGHPAGAAWGSPGLLAVLFVGDVRAPGRAVALFVHLEHREMGHEAVGGGAVPVILARREEDAVAGADDLDRPAAQLRAADAFRDVDGLAV